MRLVRLPLRRPKPVAQAVPRPYRGCKGCQAMRKAITNIIRRTR